MSRPDSLQTPQFIPAYSVEAWNALDRESDHEMILIIDQYVDDVAPIRNGPMAVLLGTIQETGARFVVELYVEETEQGAVTALLDYIL